MTADPPLIDVVLVRRLVDEQFPELAGLPVTEVERQGSDNRTFRLGDKLSVRLPSAAAYEAQVDKEQRWLPHLAPRLPLPVPVPVRRGAPGTGYPYAWSVLGWLPGEPVRRPLAEPVEVAGQLAGFLTALQQVDPTGGPPPGPHCFWRGGPLATYDGETRQAVEALAGVVDVARATTVWEAALAARWEGRPVWFHGDVAAGNLLLRDDRLAAVLDFGCCGVGDPACDLTAAWTVFSGEARSVFRRGLALDDATWARARGWALWKALITAGESGRGEPLRVAREVLADG